MCISTYIKQQNNNEGKYQHQAFKFFGLSHFNNNDGSSSSTNLFTILMETLTKHKFTIMYFYISKTNKNEQTQLLEMRSNACIRFRNGFSVCIANNNRILL